jgi:hypothetical protein
MILLSLTKPEVDAFVAAVQDASLITSQVENVAALLALIIQEGDHDGHFGIADMAALTSRALAGFGEAHNEALVNLGSRLKDAVEVEAMP